MLPVACRSLHMLEEEEAGSRVGTLCRWLGRMPWPGLLQRIPSVMLISSGTHLPILPFISPTKQPFAYLPFQMKDLERKHGRATSEGRLKRNPSGSEDAVSHSRLVSSKYLSGSARLVQVEISQQLGFYSWEIWWQNSWSQTDVTSWIWWSLVFHCSSTIRVKLFTHLV